LANRQVRLDPDVTGYVEECAYDWDVSLSAATNRLIRAVRDEPAPTVAPAASNAVDVTVPVRADGPPPVRSPARSSIAKVTPRGAPNSHIAALLRSNADQ
jgi:hypothetical protein